MLFSVYNQSMKQSFLFILHFTCEKAELYNSVLNSAEIVNHVPVRAGAGISLQSQRVFAVSSSRLMSLHNNYHWQAPGLLIYLGWGPGILLTKLTGDQWLRLWTYPLCEPEPRILDHGLEVALKWEETKGSPDTHTPAPNLDSEVAVLGLVWEVTWLLPVRVM